MRAARSAALSLRTATMVLVLLAAAPDIAVSQEALPFPTDWFEWETATGVWGGARTELEDAGITWSLNYTADLLANPVGGIRRETAYASELYGSLAFDFGKLLGIPGLTFYAAGTVHQGRSLSEDAIGNVFGVAEVFAGDTVRLAQLYFEQSFYQDRLQIAVGRLSAGNDFAVARSFGYYVNGAVNGNPTTLLENLPSFTTTPFAQWGARMTIIPADFLYFSAGAYNADPSVQDDDKHGVDFTLNPADGVVLQVELMQVSQLVKESLLDAGKFVITQVERPKFFLLVEGSLFNAVDGVAF